MADSTRTTSLRRLALGLAAVLVLSLVVTAQVRAADPTEGSVSPAAPELAWEGMFYAAAAAEDPLDPATCPSAADDPDNEVCDHFTLTVDADAAYLAANPTAGTRIRIEWGLPDDDFDLFVYDSTGKEVASSASGVTTSEEVTIPQATGVYEVRVNPFSVTASGYDGSAALLDDVGGGAEGVDGLAAAPSQGLGFSASVPADLQRDEGEPLIDIDADGRIYTCGPTGASQVNEYAQVSTDGGDQFHLLGEPPRGQLSTGEGGGDCSIATAPVKAEGQENFSLTYSGLGPLTNFTTGGSTDGGRTVLTSPVSESIPAVDRQWNTFLDEDTVLLNYNNIGSGAPRQVVVQRSDDGGLTYGPRVPATPINPLFPGPLRTLPAEFNPEGEDAGPVAYFPWSEFGGGISLSMSTDGGATWQVCQAAQAPGEPALFAVADHDEAGNIYITYSEETDFHTYVTALPADRLADCNEVVTEGDQELPTTNPGFLRPVQVDRGEVRSSVFGWITAGGAPGRVQVAFYGSETDGNPGDVDFEGTWHVYVNQSLNALAPDATFSQVRATTHPNHYDQISLGGFSPLAPADRSLVDFFAIDYNAANGETAVVFNRAHKRPGDDGGLTSTPVVLHQSTGPSNGGSMLDSGEPATLRTSSTDPTEDAIADFSSLGTPPNPMVVPASDFLSTEVGPFVDLETGEEVEDGGFTVTMTLDDLSDEALQQALSASDGQSLLWIFRFVDGYRYSAASARYSTGGGFTFGFNDYLASTDVSCTDASPSGSECLQYPGDVEIQGAVDQEAGTIRLSVPLELLKALVGPARGEVHPQEVEAQPGDRIPTAAAFSVSNTVSPTQDVQSYLYPLDNSPAMDFLVPGEAPPGPRTTSRPSPDPSATPTQSADPGDGSGDEDGDGDGGTEDRSARDAQEEPGDELVRIGGAGRIQTAVRLSREAFPDGADQAILARADQFPDALTASALAAEIGGPVLLTGSDQLDDDTAAELRRLDATRVYLAGGEAALSPQVASDAASAGLEAERLGGATRVDTAGAIAREVVELGGRVTQAVVARSDDFADALAAGNLATTGRAPILLTGTDDLPDATVQALSDVLSGTDVFVAGGPAAVGEGPAQELRDAGYTVQRRAGATRYGTAVQLVEEAVAQGAGREPTLLASGTNFPDALTAVPTAHSLGGSLILVDPLDVADSPEIRDYLQANADEIETAVVAGGTAAVSERVADQILGLIRNRDL